MTRIFSLDIASTTGYALYDTARPPSAIVSGSVKFIGDNAFEKVGDMRRKLPKLIREYRPDFVVIEAPLAHVPSFKKKKKTLFGEEEEVSTINPGTIMQLNRLAGAAQICVQGYNVPCVEVRAQTWMSVIPSTIKGPTKKRVSDFCQMLKIVAPNQDAKDACIIAVWCAGHSQELAIHRRHMAAIDAMVSDGAAA